VRADCDADHIFAVLVGLGGAPLLAMRLGEGNRDGARAILANCTVLLAALSAVLTAGVFLASRAAFARFWRRRRADALCRAVYALYYAGDYFQRRRDRAESVYHLPGVFHGRMLTIALGALTNIVLDPVFIFVLDLGCAGAAIATSLSQAVSFVFVLCFLCSTRPHVRIGLKGLSAKIMRRVLKFGFSPFIILATDSVVIIALNSALARFGGAQSAMLIACATITQSYMQLISMPLLGLSGGTQPLISFNFGARKIDRIRQGERFIMKTGLVFTGVMLLATQFACAPFARIFTRDAALIDFSVRAIRVYTLMIVPMTFQYCLVDALTALGVARIAMTLSLNRKLAMLALTLLMPAAGMGAFSLFGRSRLRTCMPASYPRWCSGACLSR
jgi:Na+-driven multidrug efflux pump